MTHISSWKHGLVLLSLLLVGFDQPADAFHVPGLQDFLSYWVTRGKAEQPQPMKAQAKSRVKRQSIGDSGIYPHEVVTSQLPIKRGTRNTINGRYMPVLSSGLIATSVYSDALYVNGLYNGKGASSHRAKVPTVVMTRVDLNDPEMDRLTTRQYKFNAFEGAFTEIIDCPFAVIEHRTYIHQKYVRVLVTDIKVRKKSGMWGGTFQLKYADVNDTADFRFETPQRYDADWKVRGRTLEAEQGNSLSNVFIYYFERLLSITLRSQQELHEAMIMAVDTLESAAKNDYDRCRSIIAQPNGAERLFAEHKEAWKKTWDRGKIELTGELLLAKITIFSQYYLLSSMHPQFAQQPPPYNSVFYGIARNSLGRGGRNADYRGHIFWDNEMYILPAIVLFHPEAARYLLRIRAAFIPQARDYAKATGNVGYRFPWETGFTGNDVTPDTCVTCKEKALHVTAAVGWSIRQYFSATRDRDFMTNPEYRGCDMSIEIAKFWANKCVYNSSKGRYDINDVMGPDDWHPNVNNNAYTNVMASLAIHWGRYFACLCQRDERSEVPDEWIQKALYVHLPYDNVKRLHYQYEGFENSNNKTNKQADTIMMTYPISWNTSRDIMRNDLEYYETLTSDRTPAMTWSFFTVGWKWADERAKMINYFLKSYQDYVVQPFKIWTEYNEASAADEAESTVNYLPGMAGFLQSLIYGFAGIRIRPEFLAFHMPELPPNCDSMKFTSFNYLGADMDIEILPDRVIITINEVGDYPLVLKRNESYGGEERMTVGARLTINQPEKGFYILTSEGNSCEHPRDYIYMPWGYSPWINQAPYPSPSCLFIIATAAISCVLNLSSTLRLPSLVSSSL